jgi:Dyp-type peroxidase family
MMFGLFGDRLLDFSKSGSGEVMAVVQSESENRQYEELVNNSRLVDGQDPNYEKIFSDLQGGIIKNYGRQYSLYIFIQFDRSKPNEVKQWIRDEIAHSVTSTLAQIEATNIHGRAVKNADFSPESGELCKNFFLSYQGYQALGLNPADLNHEVDDTHFVNGMKAEWEGNYRLENPPAPGGDYWYNPPKNWDMGDDPIDALIFLAHSSVEKLAAAAQAIIKKFVKVGKVLTCEAGYRLKNSDGYSVVSFGFADGISQPIFLKSDYKKYLTRQGIGRGDVRQWQPQASLSLALVKDPLGEAYSYGSYCVFQKIETNNDIFAQQLQELQSALAVDDERANALVVGRFKDGTPLALSAKPSPAGSANANIDNFNFADDPNGNKCPLHAHVRKVNPRHDEDEHAENRRNTNRIVRAGMTYFDNPRPHSRSKLQACLQKLDYLKELSGRTITENVPSISGLLFVCFQSSIDNQFGFIQRQWADDSEFPREREDGANEYLDPIIGNPANINRQRLPDAQEWPKKWGKTSRSAQSFWGCAKVRGGEFFFVPSISFLKKI